MSNAEEDIDIFAEETEEEKELNKKNAEKKQAQKEASAKHTKSQVVVDIKPWEAETDLDKLAEILRSKQVEGLVWGAMEKRPLAFGVNKLVVVMTIDDHLVSADDIEELIMGEEDYVQSYEVTTWNKL
jgi:elongation factor 1-beta